MHCSAHILISFWGLCMRQWPFSCSPAVVRYGSLCTLPLFIESTWRQLAFWLYKHPPLSKFSPKLTLDLFIHTCFVSFSVCACVCVLRLLWQLPPLTVPWLYALDSGARKPDEVIQLCMLSNWQAVAILCGVSALHAHTPDVSRFGHYLWHS